MKQTIGFCQFTDAFRDHGRQDQFTYEAKKVLFDYYGQLEEDIGEEIKLDVIAICCEWSEYETQELINAYGDEGQNISEVENYCEDNTIIIKLDNGSYLIQQF